MRLPLELYLYVGRELLRLFLLTAFVLVWIIALGAAVKPITEGQLSLGGTLRYLTLALVPMLPFAAPFAAGFAATLSYHRLASDNELLACTASGISYRAVLLPAVVLGIALSGVLVVVSHQIVPGVIRQMERMLQADVGTLLVTAINRGEGVQFDQLSIYADEAISYGPDPKSGAYEQIDLLGLAIADGSGRRDNPRVYTARRALARLFDEQGETVVVVTLFEAAGMLSQERERDLLWLEWLQPAWQIPSRVRHNPKYENWRGLAELYENPDLYPEIRELGQELAQAIGRWHITRELMRQLRSAGETWLISSNGEDLAEFRVIGADVTWDEAGPRIVPDPEHGSVVVRLHKGGAVLQYEAAEARIMPGHDEYQRDRGAHLNLELPGPVIVRDLATPDDRNVLDGYTWRRLQLRREHSPAENLMGKSTDELLAEAADPKYDGDGFIRPHADATRERVERLRREITSKHHERVALSASCLVMLFTGAVMAIRLRAALPLLVYLWSFLPALGTVILISSGQQVMRTQAVFSGALLLWSGIAALAVMGLLVYSQVRKH